MRVSGDPLPFGNSGIHISIISSYSLNMWPPRLLKKEKRELYICIYFKIIFYWLCYYSCLDFFPFCPPPPSNLHSFRQSPHHCSCPWVMRISSLATLFPMLYFTSPWLFCNYLLVLPNPLTSSPIPPHPPPIWQPWKHSVSDGGLQSWKILV